MILGNLAHNYLFRRPDLLYAADVVSRAINCASTKGKLGFIPFVPRKDGYKEGKSSKFGSQSRF